MVSVLIESLLAGPLYEFQSSSVVLTLVCTTFRLRRVQVWCVSRPTVVGSFARLAIHLVLALICGHCLCPRVLSLLLEWRLLLTLIKPA